MGKKMRMRRKTGTKMCLEAFEIMRERQKERVRTNRETNKRWKLEKKRRHDKRKKTKEGWIETGEKRH